MFESLYQSFLGIQNALQTNPKLFLTIFSVGLVLIWAKYRFIRYGVKRADRQTYAGWNVKAKPGKKAHPTGIGHRDVLIMRPVKVIPLALFCLILFGGGAILVASQEPPGLKVWFSVGIGCVFSALSLWMIVFSFTRIVYDGEMIERRALFRAPVSASLSALTDISPINKTIAGGANLQFRDGQRLRVIARMSGYQQFLEKLALHDPKLALLLRMTRQSQQVH